MNIAIDRFNEDLGGEAQTLAFDPGLRCSGFAAFDADDRLIYAGLAVPNDDRPRDIDGACQMAFEVQAVLDDEACIDAVASLVYEKPQIYENYGDSGVDTDDVVQLAYVNGALGALLDAPETVGLFPREWKGQVPKEVSHRRAKAALDDPELEVIDRLERYTKHLRHNALDAVALGLYFCKRTL